MRKTILTTMLAMLAALALAFGADAAFAFKRSSSVTGPGGKTATDTATVNKTGSGYQRTNTATGPGGKTASSSTEGSWNASTKTWDKSKTYTTPSGKTGTVDKSTTYSK